tara:strand:- start:1396 stop:1509 length:114 start_codon:yes stop_codon:yes gene_type:complete
MFIEATLDLKIYQTEKVKKQNLPLESFSSKKVILKDV